MVDIMTHDETENIMYEDDEQCMYTINVNESRIQDVGYLYVLWLEELEGGGVVVLFLD